MGIALWLVAGGTAFALGRLIPYLRPRVLGELTVSLLVSVVLGGIATALDFGGWNELEWRAALFVLMGTFSVIAVYRLLTPEVTA